jgi:rhodanese-related sulfurtransferase
MTSNSIREAITLCAVAVVPALLAVSFHPDLANRHRAGLETAEVRLAEVRDWHTHVIWVDARNAGEYDQDHIPGALHFDQGRFDSSLGSLLAEWKPGTSVVVYCGSDSCETSRTIAVQLRAAGFDEAFYLRGGWDAWLVAKR